MHSPMDNRSKLLIKITSHGAIWRKHEETVTIGQIVVQNRLAHAIVTSHPLSKPMGMVDVRSRYVKMNSGINKALLIIPL